MNNETYIDFCFVREVSGHFSEKIDEMLKVLFKGLRLNWYLDEKTDGNAEIVIAEVKGMSRFTSEEEACTYLEENAGQEFWEYLQGYKMYIYPASYRINLHVNPEVSKSGMKGCNSCEGH